MVNSILNIGVSGLNAAQANLQTTSHNISNANTPGYNRQQVIQNTNISISSSAGFIGSGVHASTVQRVYSEFLVTQALQTQTKSSQLDTYAAQITQINNMVADASAGLSPALQDFFSSIQDVATNPASVPSRQGVLNNAEALITRFQVMDQRLSQSRDGINKQITSTVSEINSLAKEIADLNHNISLAKGQASGQPPNDLLDQRDALTNELSKLIKTNVVQQSNGPQNIFIGNGQPLVVGTEPFALRAITSPQEPESVTIGFVSGNNTILIPEKQLQDGGSLGGLLAYRNETLDSAQNALGRIAIGLAQTFNDQHRLGQDLNGNLGRDFFTVPAPQVISDARNNATSSVTATINDVGALTTSDYQFTFDGTNYSLTRLSDNHSISTAVLPSNAAPLTLDGFSITNVNINANESFIVQPTRNGARNIALAVNDTSHIAAAAPIRTEAAISNTGTGVISAGNVNPLPLDPNLQQPVTITFHSPFDGQFDVTGVGAGLPANNQIFTPGDDISFNGFTVQIDGNPAAGDTFTIGPNTNAISDNRNALLLSGLQTQNLMAGGTASFQATYGQLVSQIGNKTRELQVTSEAQANLLAQTHQSLQSLSGVNLEEEAANLIRFQHAFQASSKVIEISNSLFDSILRI